MEHVCIVQCRHIRCSTTSRRMEYPDEITRNQPRKTNQNQSRCRHRARMERDSFMRNPQTFRQICLRPSAKRVGPTDASMYRISSYMQRLIRRRRRIYNVERTFSARTLPSVVYRQITVAASNHLFASSGRDALRGNPSVQHVFNNNRYRIKILEAFHTGVVRCAQEPLSLVLGVTLTEHIQLTIFLGAYNLLLHRLANRRSAPPARLSLARHILLL